MRFAPMKKEDAKKVLFGRTLALVRGPTGDVEVFDIGIRGLSRLRTDYEHLATRNLGQAGILVRKPDGKFGECRSLTVEELL